jgi:hypothetical protein
VSTSEVSVSLTVEDGTLSPSSPSALGEVAVERGRAIVCVVGEGLRRTQGIAARVFETVRELNVLLISQGASRVNLTFVVDHAQVADAVVRLHAALVETQGAGAGVGAAAVRPRAGAAMDLIGLARHSIDIPSVSGGGRPRALLAGYLGDRLPEIWSTPPGYSICLLRRAPTARRLHHSYCAAVHRLK